MYRAADIATWHASDFGRTIEVEFTDGRRVTVANKNNPAPAALTQSLLIARAINLANEANPQPTARS